MDTCPKIGTMREDGLVFGGKAPKSKSGQWWTTPEKLAKRIEQIASIRKKNKTKYNAKILEWRKANPEKVQAQKARAHAKRKADRKQHREENPTKVLTPEERRIRKNIRQRTTRGIKDKGWTKSQATQKTIGCTWTKLKTHLESKFKKGMTWDNYGQWHVDHILPLASATCPEHLTLLTHYSNLQPLWKRKNLSKGAKLLAKHTK